MVHASYPKNLSRRLWYKENKSWRADDILNLFVVLKENYSDSKLSCISTEGAWEGWVLTEVAKYMCDLRLIEIENTLIVLSHLSIQKPDFFFLFDHEAAYESFHFFKLTELLYHIFYLFPICQIPGGGRCPQMFYHSSFVMLLRNIFNMKDPVKVKLKLG